MVRPKGMVPAAYFSYLAACKDAGISPPMKIVQTVGNAPASAGVHKADGYITIGGVREAYTGALDISLHSRADGSDDPLSLLEIKSLLDHLASHGFVAWFRNWDGNKHIHGVYVAVKLKSVLQKQVQDFLHDRNGLAGHQPETFFTGSKHQDDLLRAVFLSANPQ